MSLFGRILGLILASVVVFTGLAMGEQWEVFEPWFAGQSTVAPLPEDARLVELVRIFAGALERGDVLGPERSPARQILEEDLTFRTQFGVRQHLVLEQIEIESKRRIGPETLEVQTRERSRLTIGRLGGSPRRYVLEGTWEYTVGETSAGLVVLDVRPTGARLADADAEPGGSTGGQSDDDGGAPEEAEP